MSVSEATTPPAGERPDEEQVREYLAQLRSAPAEHVVGDVVFGLVNAAQAKLGRRDARLFIDLVTRVVDQTRSHLSDDLVKQVDQIVGQLRLAQIQAESAAARSGSPEEPNDLPAQPAAPTAAEPAAPASSPAATPWRPTEQPQSQPSKLWVPGRDF